jgi:hypothetical protein
MRACGAPLTLETYRPSGPDGAGQARGQARNARGEPLDRHSSACERQHAELLGFP